MKGAKPSRTAQGVAAERALMHELGVISDPFARPMLHPTTAAIVALVRRWPRRWQTRSVTLAGLAARTLWFDGQVIDALDGGLAQVVIVGAGYDSRAWRFPRASVQFFELDHPATQQDKVRRAPGPGPEYVSLDLTTASVVDALQSSRFDASRPALFVFEGVTMYLREGVVRRQLRELAVSSASRSRLAVGFQPPRDSTSTVHRRQARLQRLARSGSGETFRLLIDRDRAVTLVEDCGWEVTEAMGMQDAARRLIPASAGLRVEAINPAMSAIAGVRV